jgi:anti-sigma factor (TIGR02949 family)
VQNLQPLSCEETFRRLDDYLDRELSPEEMAAVREHLARCEYCAREFVFEANVLKEVRAKIARISLPSSLLSRLARALDAAEREPTPN